MRRTPAAGPAPPRSWGGSPAGSVPRGAVGAPGRDGRREWRFRPAAGGTRLVHDYATAPFHVSGTLDHDPHPDAETVFVQSPTGGVAQGDRLTRHVDVGGDAVAHVSAGSATKVQSMTRNYAASEASLAVASPSDVPGPDPDEQPASSVAPTLAPSAKNRRRR